MYTCWYLCVRLIANDYHYVADKLYIIVLTWAPIPSVSFTVYITTSRIGWNKNIYQYTCLLHAHPFQCYIAIKNLHTCIKNIKHNLKGVMWTTWEKRAQLRVSTEKVMYQKESYACYHFNINFSETYFGNVIKVPETTVQLLNDNSCKMTRYSITFYVKSKTDISDLYNKFRL